MSPDSAGWVNYPSQLTHPAESGDIDYLKWVNWLIIDVNLDTICAELVCLIQLNKEKV